MTLTDTIAKALEAHRPVIEREYGNFLNCQCGWNVDPKDPKVYDWQYRIHLAQVLSEAIEAAAGSQWDGVRQRILKPGRCGQSGHFEFQENGNSCLMCQREHQLIAGALAAHFSQSEPAAPASDAPTPGMEPREHSTLAALRLYYDKKDGCKHPFGVGKVCIDCVAELLAEREAAAVAAAYQKAADIVESYSGYSDENTGSQMLCQQLTRAAAKEILALADSPRRMQSHDRANWPR